MCSRNNWMKFAPALGSLTNNAKFRVYVHGSNNYGIEGIYSTFNNKKCKSIDGVYHCNQSDMTSITISPGTNNQYTMLGKQYIITPQ